MVDPPETLDQRFLWTLSPASHSGLRVTAGVLEAYLVGVRVSGELGAIVSTVTPLTGQERTVGTRAWAWGGAAA